MSTEEIQDLAALDAAHDFLQRHIGPNAEDQQKMLRELGFESLEALIATVVPPDILERERIAGRIPDAISENDVLEKLEAISQKNVQVKSLIGQGYYNNHTPQVIIRNVLENPGWYTAYTPYQAEIAQGRLEALANFQTVIMDLTALPIANASLLDEATAAAEAMTMCLRSSKNKQHSFFIADNCHPQTIDVLRTRAHSLSTLAGSTAMELIVAPIEELSHHAAKLFGALFQYPGTRGEIRDYSEQMEMLKGFGALGVLSCDLLSLTLLKPPGEMGAAIAIGSAQRFGVPLGFGGPHAAFMACRQELKRSMPGRIIGLSKDRCGNPAYRMSLQTREQHIRREKATSNICTAQVLLAIIAGFYAVYFGPDGLLRIARRVVRLTRALAAGLRSAGYALQHDHFFDTICIESGEKTELLLQLALEEGYNLRRIDSRHLGISFDDTTKKNDVRRLLVRVFFKLSPNISQLDASLPAEDISAHGAEELAQFYERHYGSSIPQQLLRESRYMEHPVFSANRSETEMMRYMRRLVNKDIALDRSMIPLGSCTMKLNSAAEMKALTLSGFANIHPFAPSDQSQGYRLLITELEYYLCAITGYDAISLQPNAGSQGEYAGLLAIRAYHQERGEGQRDICLIPISAHGTNPASATMAGMRVQALRCDEQGNVDLANLRSVCAQQGERIACIMITYPSTHGVFEEGVRELCDIVHRCGGQVYIDGANMNAQIGLTYPGRYGGDVSHLNLHKTFAIPHGGGGPGVGPVLCRSHLAPYLPGHRLLEKAHNSGRELGRELGREPGQTPVQGGFGAVSAAPWGSASVLTITYAYISLLGFRGLRRASEVAILSANYIAARLAPYYSILYRGKNGYIAHECILDIRPLERELGVTCEDIAKRLMDFGIHSPTMAFPVPGTLMVEPTESESLGELERFIAAMICIRSEMEELQSGEASREDNVLKNAPHTVQELSADEWSHSYSREKAAFALPSLRKDKIWPAVARIDNVYGDRNLFCSCAPDWHAEA